MFPLVVFLFLTLCTIGVNGNCQEQNCMIKSFIDATFNKMSQLIKDTESAQNASLEIEVAKKEIKKLKMIIKKFSDKLETSISAVYTRWGSSTCPKTADLVYSGYTGGSNHQKSGGGAHPVCLFKDPTFGEHKTQPRVYALIYGTEYQVFGANPKKHDQDVPCTVCRTRGHSTVHMTPGKNTCESEWDLEYDGYLMSEHEAHSGRSAFLCVDENMDALPDGNANKNGNLLHYVSPSCGSLPCLKYKTNPKFYLKCAVCSK